MLFFSGKHCRKHYLMTNYNDSNDVNLTKVSEKQRNVPKVLEAVTISVSWCSPLLIRIFLEENLDLVCMT